MENAENENVSETWELPFVVPTFQDSLTVGGHLENYPLDKWPFFADKALTFLGEYKREGIRYIIFLDPEDNKGERSWQPEDGSNAVVTLVGDEVKAPAWITLGTVEKPVERLTAVYDVAVTEEPEWLQGDESIPEYSFCGQIDSGLDPELNIGDAHGVAYLFVNEDSKDARLLWQA